MALDLDNYLKQADEQLTRQGLYTTIKFTDVKETTDSYDPITGEYTQSSTTTYTLSGVVLGTNHNVGYGASAFGGSENNYSVTTEVIILPQYITFPVVVDQVYTINEERWQLINFKVAPQDSLYTFTLGRK